MRKKIIKSILVPLVGGLFFTGCAKEYTSVTTFGKTNNNLQAHIIANQEIGMNNFARGSLRRTNYKYALAAAAQTTLDDGFKYFTIVKPTEMKQLLISKRVKTVEDVYEACDKGEDSFQWSFSGRQLLNDLGSSTINRCDTMLKASYGNGFETFEPIYITVTMSNNYIENSGMIDAKETLSSELIKDLDLSDFKPYRKNR